MYLFHRLVWCCLLCVLPEHTEPFCSKSLNWPEEIAACHGVSVMRKMEVIRNQVKHELKVIFMIGAHSPCKLHVYIVGLATVELIVLLSPNTEGDKPWNRGVCVKSWKQSGFLDWLHDLTDSKISCFIPYYRTTQIHRRTQQISRYMYFSSQGILIIWFLSGMLLIASETEDTP
jgi:hypothetical protein